MSDRPEHASGTAQRDPGTSTPGIGDHRDTVSMPTTASVDGAADRADRAMAIDPSTLLLRHCFALGATAEERPPARARLEAELGRDLTRRLLRSLTSAKRR